MVAVPAVRNIRYICFSLCACASCRYFPFDLHPQINQCLSRDITRTLISDTRS